MNSLPYKILTIFAASLFLASCKLAVIVTEGGDVQSSSTTRDCAGGLVCEFEISDTTFSDTFTAVPRPGYQFTHWRNGGSDFLCADAVSPACALSNIPLAGNVFADAIIASFQLFHIMPVFEFVGIDTDLDGIFDHLDDDDDNDGLLDGVDPCPLNPDPACGPTVIEQLVATSCWTVSADVGNATAQSFTPAVSGDITAVGLAVESDASNNYLYIIEGDIDGDVMHVQPLVTPTITASTAAMVPAVLTASVAVTAGQQYTIAVDDSGGFGMRFCGSGANPYAGGQAYHVEYFVSSAFPTDDAAFSITIE